MKKKILIITGIYPPDIGGPATFVKELSEYIDKREDTLKVITLQDFHYLNIFEKDVIKIPRFQNKFIRTLNLIFTIRKYSKDVDSILCCGLLLETYISQLGFNNKIIYRFVSDSIYDKYLSKTKDVFNRGKVNLLVNFLFFVRNKILRSFDVIIVPSEYLKKYYLRKIEKREIKVIRNFASKVNNFSYKNNNKLNPDLKNTINFIVISRLVQSKNINFLLDVFKELSEFNLHIFGAGPEESKYKDFIIRNKLKNIFMYGLKKRDEIFKALINYDCFIQISSVEGMSFSILEALSLSKPLILSNIEPNFETAKNAAIYVNPFSRSQIKESIKLLKSKKIREIMSENSKKVSNEFYDKKNSLKLYYEEL